MAAKPDDTLTDITFMLRRLSHIALAATPTQRKTALSTLTDLTHSLAQTNSPEPANPRPARRRKPPPTSETPPATQTPDPEGT